MNWWTSILNALGAERYSQHAICLANDPIILTVFVGSDLFIAASYYLIGLGLLLKRHLILQLSPQAIALYGAFILLCGSTHVSHILTQFAGVYRLEAVVTAATAAVSTITAVYTAMALWFDEAPGARIQSD